MNATTKEIVKICTTGKMKRYLKEQWKIHGYDLVWDKKCSEIDYVRDIIDTFWNKRYVRCCWLPISFDLKHNCLQIEWLLMKKLGIKSLLTLNQKFSERVRDYYFEDGYVLECLYWLKELVEGVK